MSYLTERLRAYRGAAHETTECYNGTRDEAADEIGSLTAQLAEAREALERIAQVGFYAINPTYLTATEMQQIALAALPPPAQPGAEIAAETPRLDYATCVECGAPLGNPSDAVCAPCLFAAARANRTPPAQPGAETMETPDA